MAPTSEATWAALPTSVWIRMYAVTATASERRRGQMGRETHLGIDSRNSPERRRTKGSMDAHERLMDRVASEQDDVLCTLPLVAHDGELSERMWGQLVDLLVESMFLDLRYDYLCG